jgi:toluene monooxygenase system protein E
VTTRRTYWHLEDLRRRPSAYDVATTRLLYYPGRGLAVHGSTEAWFERYQQGTRLICRDWSAFRDPRETTYTSYVERQRDREAFVDGVLRTADDGDTDRRLPARWVDTLARILAPLRYPSHGLQMAASYVAHMAPEGRIVVTGLFQVGDEMRRVQRLAYRLRQLQLVHEVLADDGRRAWEDDAAWQPLREMIERLLVTYDWGEAFTALCLVVKPAFDELVDAVGREAQRAGDHVLQQLCFSFGEDAAWHRDWAIAMARVAILDRPENRAEIAAWTARWWPRARAAAEALAPIIVGAGTGTGADAVVAGVERACRRSWTPLELEVA